MSTPASTQIARLRRRIEILKADNRDLLKRLRRWECPNGHSRIGYEGSRCPICRITYDRATRAEKRRWREATT